MRDIKDGAVVKAMVGVSRCELTSDLSYCKVYITTLEGGDTTKNVAEHLKKAEGFFKRRINERVKTVSYTHLDVYKRQEQGCRYAVVH